MPDTNERGFVEINDLIEVNYDGVWDTNPEGDEPGVYSWVDIFVQEAELKVSVLVEKLDDGRVIAHLEYAVWNDDAKIDRKENAIKEGNGPWLNPVTVIAEKKS